MLKYWLRYVRLVPTRLLRSESERAGLRYNLSSVMMLSSVSAKG